MSNSQVIRCLESVAAWIEHWQADFRCNLKPTPESLIEALVEVRSTLAILSAASCAQATTREPMEMLVSPDWLRRKVETDPDIETDALPSADRERVEAAPAAADLVCASLEACLPFLREIQSHCGPGEYDEIIARAEENAKAYRLTHQDSAGSERKD